MESESVTPEMATGVEERFLDDLGLLLRNAAVFRATSLRIQELAGNLTAVARSAFNRRTLTVVLADDGILIRRNLYDLVGPRQEVAQRLGSLNVRRIHFAPTLEPADLIGFAAVVNREVAVINQARAVTASWIGLPDSVVVDEATFSSGLGDLDARLDLTPELSAVRELLSPDRLEGFLEKLEAIRESLQGETGGVIRRVDVLAAVADRLSEVDKESPERAEALIEEALVRFRSLLGSLQERDVSPVVRGMVQDVAERFFPRPARDCRVEPPDARGRSWKADELPDSAGAVDAIRGLLAAFLEESHPTVDVLEPVPDASYLHLLSRYLTEDTPSAELRAAAHHLASLLEQGKLAGHEKKLRKFIFTRLHAFPDHRPLNPLLYRLVGAEEIAEMLERFDLNAPEQVTRFADMALVVLPQAITGLFRFLENEDIRFQAGLLRRMLRALGRDEILAAGADLRESPLFAEAAFLARLRRLRIAEVLPIVEVLYDAKDPDMRLAGFSLARAYPFRCRAAFWLRAANRPQEAAADYVHAVLGLEWDGCDDDALFDRLLSRAEQDAVDPQRSEFGIRALKLANTDAAAEALIEICEARSWPWIPVHPRPLREAAQHALGEMTCKSAIEWNL